MSIRLRVLFCFALLSIFSPMTRANANLHQTDVHGLLNKIGKSDQKDITLALVDVGDADLIHCILVISDSFGSIEAGALMIYDAENKKIGRVVIATQALDPGKKVFEFDLGRPLIQNSYILVSHRDKDDLYAFKVLLGAFPIAEKSKHP